MWSWNFHTWHAHLSGLWTKSACEEANERRYEASRSGYRILCPFSSSSQPPFWFWPFPLLHFHLKQNLFHHPHPQGWPSTFRKTLKICFWLECLRYQKIPYHIENKTEQWPAGGAVIGTKQTGKFVYQPSSWSSASNFKNPPSRALAAATVFLLTSVVFSITSADFTLSAISWRWQKMTKSVPAYLSSKFSHSNQESKLRLFYLVFIWLELWTQNTCCCYVVSCLQWV